MGESEIPESCAARPIENPSLELCRLLAELDEKQRNKNYQIDRKPTGSFTNRAGDINFLPEISLGSEVPTSLKDHKSDETDNRQSELTKVEKRWVGPDAELHFADREKTLQAILERQNARVISTDVGDQNISRLMPLPEPLPLLDYDSKISSMLANFDINIPEHLRKSTPIK